ncbi:MAG: V-type ATP synthase subunit D [Candidatus Diapherotrites archaeon]|nr:V-type ATP synthase subunit D [Candidatus Diapherotrites archaeon]
MAEDFRITRLELIETKGKIRLAEKGHKLLKQKRDVLVLEFFKILKKAKDLRSEMNSLMSKSFKALGMAEAYHGVYEIENIALSVKKAPNIDVTQKNVMGVRIPEINSNYVSKTLLERGYSIVGSSAKIDETAGNFEKSLELVIKLAETETALKRMIKEIEKTKRRVNALEYVMMPKLHEKKKFIASSLDEMERGQFVSLKAIKSKMARNAKTN